MEYYEKKPMNKGVLIAIIILAVIVLSVGGYFAYELLFNKDTNDAETEKPKEEEKQELDLSIDGEFIKSLLETIDYNKQCGTPFSYFKGEVTIANLSDELKLCSAYNKILPTDYTVESVDSVKGEDDYPKCVIEGYEFYNYNDAIEPLNVTGDYDKNKCYITKINRFKFEDAFKSLYGSVASINHKETVFTRDGKCEYKNNGNYFCYSYVWGEESPTFDKRIAVNAVQNAEAYEIVIYEKYVYAADGTIAVGAGNDVQVACYKDSSMTEFIGDCSENMVDLQIDDLYVKENGQLFAHTFKLDSNDNYYWYSTKKVQE